MRAMRQYPFHDGDTKDMEKGFIMLSEFFASYASASAKSKATLSHPWCGFSPSLLGQKGLI